MFPTEGFNKFLTDKRFPVPNATIQAQHHSDGSAPDSFEWVGPEDGIAAVGGPFLEDGTLRRLPWRLKKVGEDERRQVMYFQRVPDKD